SIMGKLTTHVLDTMNGCPAAGMAARLYREGQPVLTLQLNHDGRADAPLLQGDALLPGRYRLVFDVAAYFRARGVELPDPPFLGDVRPALATAPPTPPSRAPLPAPPGTYPPHGGSGGAPPPPFSSPSPASRAAGRARSAPGWPSWPTRSAAP